MIVEVRGANTHNKGAELMLRAILEEVRGVHEVAVQPRLASREERVRLGLLHRVGHIRVPDAWISRAWSVAPSRLRRELKRRWVVGENDVGGVLDAAGFAYSDQFDLRRSEMAAAWSERARRAGRPVVLLPQAFGPFESPPRRDAFVRIVANSDRVYARERVSLEHALDTGCDATRLALAPDFTCLLDGQLPSGLDLPERLALVVPSAKLLTATSDEVREHYLPFLAATVRLLVEDGHEPRILVHERGDVGTVELLQRHLGERLPVLQYDNALHLKGVIGRAQVVVGSRFHALVSALSQGVPALGVGWSHKYEMLFDDYGCREHVVDPRLDTSALSTHLRRLTDEGPRSELIAQLHEHAAAERDRSRAMWSEVRGLLS